MSKRLLSIPYLLTAVIFLGLALLFARPAAAQTPMPERPVVVIESYYLDKDTIQVGDTFTLSVTLRNKGDEPASNLILSMLNDSFLPQAGGVVALDGLSSQGSPNSSRTVDHPFLVSTALAGQTVGVIPARLTYNGPDGTLYTESFSITLGLVVYTSPLRTQTPTPTPTTAPVVRPQLVIETYATDVDPLQPGTIFSLELDVRNLGNADARAASMVLGGGVSPDPAGTPTAGGVPGGSGDLSTFAPLRSSNIIFLGDVVAGAQVKTQSKLIVNVSANPGAYTLRLSFVYTDQRGIRLVDDQIITLLIYQIPQMEASFYRDPNPLFAGQMNVLPLQVVNLGRKSAVLGNMTVSSDNADLTNNVSLVGPLDPGGSFTLDANYTPFQPGEQTLRIAINYTDDFNQTRQINLTVPVNVQEMPPPPEIIPGGEGAEGPGGLPSPVEENLWQKIMRFFRGLFGLGSAQPQPVPSEEIPAPVKPIQPEGKSVPGGKG
jgi:hypothetical protein